MRNADARWLVRHSWALLAAAVLVYAAVQLGRATTLSRPTIAALAVVALGAAWSARSDRSILGVLADAFAALHATLLRLSEREQRILDWCVLAGGVALAVVGVLGGVDVLVLLGATAIAAVVALLTPELMLCALVVAGGVKAAPWLSGLPVDLTLVAWLGTVFAMLMRSLRPGPGIPRLPVGMLLAVPLVGVVVASTLWSLDESTGASKALQFELVTMTAFVAPAILIRTRAALVRVTVVLVAFGLLIALTTVRTSNLGEPLAAAGGNQIQAALYPAVGVVCITTYLVLLTRGVRRLVLLLPLVVLVPATFGAGSRGVFIAAIAVGLYVGGRAVAMSRRRGVVLACIGAAVLAGVLFWPSLAGPAADRYKRQLLSTDVSRVLGDREYLYEHGASLAASNPISGVGAGGFAYASMVYEENQYPHNIFIEFASEEGILAAGLFGMLVIAAWRARLHASVGVAAPETLFSGALILLFLSEAMVSFDINGNRGLWFALGLAFALPGLEVPRRVRR
jgi:O-antigen ligase